METNHVIITLLSLAILALSIYIFVRKQRSSSEHFSSPQYDDMGAGHAWDNQDYAALGM